MIELRLKAEFEEAGVPFVAKLHVSDDGNSDTSLGDEHIALAIPNGSGRYQCRAQQGAFELHCPAGEPIDGDVLLCVPSRGSVQRLFRRSSRHNTLLFTERCDQICVMCSQPPKNTDDSWLFPLYEQALLLVDRDAVIGISGGEPTLYKDSLLGMIERISDQRPDISYHILSNGQHFTEDDRERLLQLHRKVRIQWGIPLYSHSAATHDQIVGKKGAFDPVMNNLFLLGGTGAQVELRTVITALNVFDLPYIAAFVARHIPFIADWAIMGLEPIGYALANREQLFFDHSAFPQPLVSTVAIAKSLGLPCHFYNIPLCTVPPQVRPYCVDSISDWKKKYLPECEQCDEKSRCTGFFEWYNSQWAWSDIKPINRGAA
jgi:His-Xaa-Ser system radical SAM maturase HxsC